MVGGVIGSALWALLRRRGELNGSGWYEFVNDHALEKAWHQEDAQEFCILSVLLEPVFPFRRVIVNKISKNRIIEKNCNF